MPITLIDFLARFSEFSTYPPAQIQLFLDDALDTIGTNWDCATLRTQQRAQALLTAHYLALFGAPTSATPSVGGGATGLVTSQKVGDLQETYAQPAETLGSKENFAKTKYGTEYLQLRAGVFISATII